MRVYRFISKKYTIIAITIIIMLLAPGCGGKVSKQEQKQQKPTPKPKVEEESKNIEPQLSGAVLTMVDNFKKARPQSGLDKADIVYEIMAEGGITRYMAVFYTNPADKVGPIRSARYYFVQLARGYDAPLAHAGGSQEALALIRSIHLKDLDEIYNSSPYFWRDKSRKPPHNLYTDTEKLLNGAKKRGYEVKPPFKQPVGTTWNGEIYKEDITLNYSVGSYKYVVTWHYNGKAYVRKINETDYKMENGVGITASNVIVMATKISTYIKDKVPLSDVKIIGEGNAWFYIDGKKMKGSWKKESIDKPAKFYDEKGELMKLKAGNTWIQVVSNTEVK